MHALMYLTAISLTTASFDSVSCLNKLPQVLRVKDFRTYRDGIKRISSNAHKVTRDNIYLSVTSPDWHEW